MKQGETSVSEFYTELKIIWTELESLRPTPKCTCEVRYNYSFIVPFSNISNQKMLFVSLKVLNDIYGTVNKDLAYGTFTWYELRVFSYSTAGKTINK